MIECHEECRYFENTVIFFMIFSNNLIESLPSGDVLIQVKLVHWLETSFARIQFMLYFIMRASYVA